MGSKLIFKTSENTTTRTANSTLHSQQHEQQAVLSCKSDKTKLPGSCNGKICVQAVTASHDQQIPAQTQLQPPKARKYKHADVYSHSQQIHAEMWFQSAKTCKITPIVSRRIVQRASTELVSQTHEMCIKCSTSQRQNKCTEVVLVSEYKHRSHSQQIYHTCPDLHVHAPSILHTQQNTYTRTFQSHAHDEVNKHQYTRTARPPASQNRHTNAQTSKLSSIRILTHTNKIREIICINLNSDFGSSEC